ncbi:MULTISPECIES: ABC transporter ATP-binding protein [unclassified Streptomyces]|uniref:ABC transporter ATP-binding protein n=1 Tax=unclassified Streptomyces TaxID=2593676 RepID=UPI002E30965B|nr:MULTISPECIES: ATP-binding cassette domain-containing protein [unclassified Streptomyces]
MSQVATDTAVRVENVHRTYGSGAAAVHALRGVSFEVPRGELVALRGRPGAGRSTLLHLVGGLDAPDAGRITVDGLEPAALDEDALLELRRDRIGLLLPSAGLVPVLTVAENVAAPLRLRGAPARGSEGRVERLLSLVGLAGHTTSRPADLSAGQRRSAALARALVHGPALLIADEPAGPPGAGNGPAFLELLRAVVRAEHLTALVAARDADPAGPADRVLELNDGRLAAH